MPTFFIPTQFFINQISKTPKYTYNKFQNKKIGHFTERNGDWICKNCKNLNFKFRTECNRCKLPKKEVMEDSNCKNMKKENKYKLENNFVSNKYNNIFNNGFISYKNSYRNKIGYTYRDNFQYNITENKNNELDKINNINNCKNNEDK